MATFLLLISWAKKLIVNPIFMIGLLAVVSFSAGWIYRGKSLDKAQVQSDLKVITETVVKYEKVHNRYRSIKPDSKRNIERMLSYEVSPNTSSSRPEVQPDSDKP